MFYIVQRVQQLLSASWIQVILSMSRQVQCRGSCSSRNPAESCLLPGVPLQLNYARLPFVRIPKFSFSTLAISNKFAAVQAQHQRRWDIVSGN